MDNVSYERSHFTGSVLKNCRLKSVNLEYCGFTNAKLDNVDFIDCHARASQWKSARLGQCHFFRCNLEMAIFLESDLQDSRYSDCRLLYANFSYASLNDSTSFQDCTFLQSKFHQAGGTKSLPHDSQILLRDEDLYEAELFSMKILSD